MPNTYRELKEALAGLTEEQLNCNLTILDPEDEYYPVSIMVSIEKETDVLDAGHPVLRVLYK